MNQEHYGGENNPYEAIKVIESWEANFNIGNALKYISRYKKKQNPIMDLVKAKWYLEREIQSLDAVNMKIIKQITKTNH